MAANILVYMVFEHRLSTILSLWFLSFIKNRFFFVLFDKTLVQPKTLGYSESKLAPLTNAGCTECVAVRDLVGL